MATCLIGLGSNEGDRSDHLNQAVALLKRTPGVCVDAISSWHETAPIGGPVGQPPYLNGAIRLQTSLEPPQLLLALQNIESRLGRVRAERWGRRPIDLDLLLYGDRIIEQARLSVPHPWMAIRRFVLVPAAEIAEEMVHPGIGLTVRQLLNHLTQGPNYVAVTGVPGTGKTSLVQSVSQRIDSSTSIRTIYQPVVDIRQILSTGSDYDAESRILELRASILDNLRLDRSSVLLTDFWLDQSLAYGELHLSKVETSRLRDEWAELRAKVPSSKLLILLEKPEEQLARSEDSAGPKSFATAQSELQGAIRGMGTRPGIGPLLRFAITHGPNDHAVTDTIAAIDAML